MNANKDVTDNKTSTT